MTEPREPAPLDEATALSPAWLSVVLDATVTGVEVTERLETVATKVRFRADIDGAPPRTLCVKAYFNPEMRARANAGEAEVEFYRTLAPSLPVRVPPSVYTGIDPDTGHALLLMEDLVAQRVTFLTALSPYSAKQAAQTLDQLALLHASTWNEPALEGHDFLDPRLPTFLAYVTAERLQSQLDGPRGDTLPDAVKNAERLRAALLAIAERDVAGPQCLVHGDTHAGNLYETADGDPGVIDWQVVQRGSWALDVAYHLGAVLDVDDREHGEQALLEHYLTRLRAHGGPELAWDDAWLEYRAHLAYGYFMWGITQMVDPPIIATFTHRLGSAVAFHDSFTLLGI